MSDTIIKTGPVDSLAFAYKRIVTAADVSNGAILFGFQVDRDLALNVQIFESSGYSRDMTGCLITQPKTGQIRVANNAAISEVSTITTVADIAGSLGGTYFTINDPSTAYYVWLDVDNGSVDPAPGGTGIEVDISANDTAETVAEAIQAAVDAQGDFGATVSGSIVTITNANAGDATDATAGTSGFTIAIIVKGKDIDGSPFALQEYDIIHVCASDQASAIEFTEREVTRVAEL